MYVNAYYYYGKTIVQKKKNPDNLINNNVKLHNCT